MENGEDIQDEKCTVQNAEETKLPLLVKRRLQAEAIGRKLRDQYQSYYTGLWLRLMGAQALFEDPNTAQATPLDSIYSSVERRFSPLVQRSFIQLHIGNGTLRQLERATGEKKPVSEKRMMLEDVTFFSR